MAYCAASTVAGYSKNILGADKIFTESSCPTITQVTGWMSTGCAILETALQSERYVVPVASTASPVYDWLSELNAKYAAAHVEFYRTNVTLSPGERTRGQVIYQLFIDELKMLLYGVDGKGSDLTLSGLSRTTAGKLYAGGISKADKRMWEEDSDRTVPAFFRQMARFPGTLDPVAGNGAS